MDVNFKGNFNKYIKDDNGNESDALSMYEDCASNLGSQLLKHYSASNVSSVTVSERFTALPRKYTSTVNSLFQKPMPMGTTIMLMWR